MILKILMLLAPVSGIASSGPQDPWGPISDLVRDPKSGLTIAFCGEWDPEFSFKGGLCCTTPPKGRGRGFRSKPRCNPRRAIGQYCSEILPAQRRYIDEAERGELGDLLPLLARQIHSRPQQAFCSVNSGFLVNGRPLVETPFNRIRLRSPARCAHFGTDPMVAMLEWTGHKVAEAFPAPEFAKTRLLIGDISPPRGGCMASKGGRRGHASHTNGLDVDIGFLDAKPGVASAEGFIQRFDAKKNWWLLKEMFANPYACIQVVFLDRRLIRQLSKVGASDKEWPEISARLQHVKHHRNHLHVRIGDQSLGSKCSPPAQMTDEELEAEEDDGPHPVDPLEELGIGF